MDWDDLRFFAAVARSGLVAKAAADLGTNPTTVSRRIQRLESTIGQILLERHRSGPRLTAAGRRLFDRCIAMEEALGAPDGPAEGQGLLRVSASEGFGTWFVAHHLADFAARHPQIDVELVATTGFLSPSRRETDVAILLAKPRQGPLVTRKLCDYRLRLYASRGLLDSCPQIATADDLPRERLIGYIPDLIYAPELDYLDEIRPGLRPQFRSSSINAQHRMIAAGVGVGVLPCFIGDGDATLATVLDGFSIRRSFWLAVHRDAQHLRTVRHFISWLTRMVETNTRLLLAGAELLEYRKGRV